MTLVQERIKELEHELSITPSNKATQLHRGRLKARIARLREQARRSSGGPAGLGYGIRKAGDATVVMAGFPSVGKSTLLNALTNAKSEVASYDFTTLTVVPGVLEHSGARLQMLDVPGLVEGAASGKGRGKEVLSVLRIADLLLIIVDATKMRQLGKIRRELYDFGIRLDKKPPRVKIIRKSTGGIEVNSTVKLTHLDEDLIKAVLNENRVTSADVLIKENLTVDEMIDSLSRNRVYVPSLVVVNKVDLVEPSQAEPFVKDCDHILVSATEKKNIEELKDKLYKKLGFIKVYTKPIGKQVDYDDPMILKNGSTIRDFCLKLHRDFAKSFRYAKIWGTSAKFPGQMQYLDHVLQDGDVVRVYK